MASAGGGLATHVEVENIAADTLCLLSAYCAGMSARVTEIHVSL